MSKCGLSLGSRLHGNLVALLNGVPALTIVHDSRTLEMCTLTGAPFINILEHDTLTADNIMGLVSELDFGVYVKNMKSLYSKMLGFLLDHGLNHRLCLPE